MNIFKQNKMDLLPFRILSVLIICLALSIVSGCGGDGGGGGGGGEITGEEDPPTPFTDHIGVWEILSVKKTVSGEESVIKTFPSIFGTVGFQITGYADIDENSITLYMGFDNIPENVTPGNGRYYCEDNIITYTLLDENTLQIDNGGEGIFEISEDILTLTINTANSDTASILFEFSQVDSSEIDGAVADCTIYEYFDM